MAAYKAITAHYADLVREVSGSVDFLADKCREQFIIGEGTYKEIIDTTKLKDVRSRTLVSCISDRVKTQKDGIDPASSIFKKFVGILRREPSLEEMASKLEVKHSELTYNEESRIERKLARRRSTIHELPITRESTLSENGLPMFTATVETSQASDQGLRLRSPETIRPLPATSQGPDQRVTDNIDVPRKILKEREMRKLWESVRKMSALSAQDEADIENYRQKCIGLQEKFDTSEYQKRLILERLEEKQRELEELSNQRFIEGMLHKSEMVDAEAKLQEETAYKEQLIEQYESCQEQVMELINSLGTKDKEIEDLKESMTELERGLCELHQKYSFENSFTGKVIACVRVGLKFTCGLFMLVCVLIAVVAAYAQITQSGLDF